MGDQTDEDSVEAVSDGEDTGFTEEESVPEEKTETENRSFRQAASDDNTYITGSMYHGICCYFCIL